MSAASKAGAVKRAFAAGGALAVAVQGYRERPQQCEMALAILEAIESNGVFTAEAGTGTGKTFAYLVPALIAGGKVILSTGTKTLQDQLHDRDLPAVRAARGARCRRRGSVRATRQHSCARSRSLLRPVRRVIAPNWRSGRRTPRCGCTPPRRARTVSARIARTTRAAS